jgi:hypothetical protein
VLGIENELRPAGGSCELVPIRGLLFNQSKLIHLRVKGVRQRGCKVDIRDVQSTLGRSHSWANIRPNNNNRRQAADFPSQRVLQPHVEGGAIRVKGRFAPGRSALIFLYWNHHDVLGIST